MIHKITEAFVEFFGSLLGLRSVIDRPLRDSRALQQLRRRPRMSHDEQARLVHDADGFAADDSISRDEMSDL